MQKLLESISNAIRLNSDECHRVFHGRGQCFPGLTFLTVDWFPSLVWVCVFAEPDEEGWLDSFKDALEELAEKARFDGTIQIQYRYKSGCPIDVVLGCKVAALQAKENGLSYEVKFGGQQNIGLFLDMANGRRWVNAHAKNANVLNLFSYTCAFSVAAIDGGAGQVINADMAKGALNWGRENHRLNNHEMDKVKFFAHDVLKSWGKFKKFGPYDLILVDPPSFQKGSFVAKKDYTKMARRFPELLAENGRVLACLNAPELDVAFLREVMGEFGFKCLQRIENPESFPEKDPDKGVKVFLFERDS